MRQKMRYSVMLQERGPEEAALRDTHRSEVSLSGSISFRLQPTTRASH